MECLYLSSFMHNSILFIAFWDARFWHFHWYAATWLTLLAMAFTCEIHFSDLVLLHLNYFVLYGVYLTLIYTLFHARVYHGFIYFQNTLKPWYSKIVASRVWTFFFGICSVSKLRLMDQKQTQSEIPSWLVALQLFR